MRNEEFAPEELSLFDKSPLDPAYVETFVYTPSSKEEETLGNLYIVLEIFSNKTKKENAEFASRLVGAIKDEFYKNTILNPISSLKFSLKRANRFLEEEKILKQTSSNLKIKTIVATISGKEMHFGRIGDAETIVMRGNVLQRISNIATTAINQKMSFENIISGEIQNTDKIIFTTSQIYKIPENTIIEKLNEKKLTDYLKTDNSGLKNLGLITLYPKQSKNQTEDKKITLSTKNTADNIDAVLASKKDKPIQKIMKEKTKIKIIGVFFAIVVCIISVTVVAIKLKNDTAKAKNEANVLVNEIADLKEKSLAMIELKNEKEALELLRIAQEKIIRLEELGYFNTSRFELSSELEKIEKILNKTENIQSLNKVFDIDVSVGTELKEISAGKNKILVFGGNYYYEYDLNRNTGSINSIEEGSKITSIIPMPENQERNIIFTQNKMMEGNNVLWENPEISRGSEIVQAEIYNNAFYLLESNSLIYKLPFEIASNTLSLNELSLWINTADTSNQGQISNFVVEGSIFALSDPLNENRISNTIVEILNGNRKNSVRIDEGILKIFSSKSFKNIYALSPTEGMLIMLDKDLNIKKRLTHQELIGAKSFFVNSQERILYFLKDKTVYSFEIN